MCLWFHSQCFDLFILECLFLDFVTEKILSSILEVVFGHWIDVLNFIKGLIVILIVRNLSSFFHLYPLLSLFLRESHLVPLFFYMSCVLWCVVLLLGLLILFLFAQKEKKKILYLKEFFASNFWFNVKDLDSLDRCS